MESSISHHSSDKSSVEWFTSRLVEIAKENHRYCAQESDSSMKDGAMDRVRTLNEVSYMSSKADLSRQVRMLQSVESIENLELEVR